MTHPTIKKFRDELTGQARTLPAGNGSIKCKIIGCPKYEQLFAQVDEYHKALKVLTPSDTGYALAVERLQIASDQKNSHIYYCDWDSFKTKPQTVEQKNRTAYKKWKDGPGW